MNDLKSFQAKVRSFLELNDKDSEDFSLASNHPLKCKCELCKKWHLIINGKYKS